MEDIAKELGFKSSEEMFKLIADADLSTRGKFKKFQDWQKNDGTKKGLLELK